MRKYLLCTFSDLLGHEASHELDTAVSLVVADGRISRIYAMRNPHKLARLDEEAKLSR